MNVDDFAVSVGVPIAGLRAWSVAEPDAFWAKVSALYGPPWFTPYTSVRGSTDRGPEAWFPGGTTNAAAWALQASDREGDAALRWVDESGSSRFVTRGELRAAAAEVHQRLVASGVRPGARVALVVTPHWVGVAALLGIMAAGAECVPIFTGYGLTALKDRLVASGAELVLAQDRTLRAGNVVDIAPAVLEAAEGIPTVVLGTASGAGDWRADDLLASTAAWAPEPRASGDGAIVLFTSGSTGPAKGVVLSHAGYTHQLASEWRLHLDLRPGQEVCWAADPGWVVGSFTVLGTLAAGGTLSLLDGPPIATFAQHPEPERIAILGGSPTFLRAVSTGESASRLSPRVIGAAGEPFNAGAWDAVQRGLDRGRGIPIINFCGGTEVGTSLLASLPTDPPVPTGFGGPALGVDADVVDDEGRPVRDQPGRLVSRNAWPGRAVEIFNNVDGLDGYFRRYGFWSQEDLAVRSDGGWFVQGRADEVLKIAGRRVGPTEIENVAVGVDGVVAAIVAAVHLRERTAVVIVGQGAGAAPATVSAAVEREMGSAFRPVWVGISDRLPVTSTGKLDRGTVKRAMAAVLDGLDDRDEVARALESWLLTL